MTFPLQWTKLPFWLAYSDIGIGPSAFFRCCLKRLKSTLLMSVEGKSDSATGPHRLSRQLRPHGIGRGGGWLIWQRRRDICGRILLLRKRTTNSHEWTQSWRWKMEAPRACGQPGEGTGMNVTTCDPFVT